MTRLGQGLLIAVVTLLRINGLLLLILLLILLRVLLRLIHHRALNTLLRDIALGFAARRTIG